MGKCVARMTHPDSKERKGYLSVCFSQEPNRIYGGGFGTDISLWTIKGDFHQMQSTHNHKDWVSRIRCSPNKQLPYFASTGWDGRMKIYNNKFNVNSSFKAHSEAIYALDISKNGNHLATAGRDRCVKVWKCKQ